MGAKLSLTTQDIPDPYIRKNFEALRDYLAALPSASATGDAVPVGFVGLWFAADSAIPEPWLKIDGSPLSRVKYPELFKVWGTRYAQTNDPPTVFRPPPLAGRVVMGTGAGSGLTERALGDTAGAETHTLSAAEMPVHKHNFQFKAATATGTQGVSTWFGNNAGGGASLGHAGPGDNNNTVMIQNAGGDGAHNNMQPSVAGIFIVKYK